MTESEPVLTVAEQTAEEAWTCARCHMTVSWAADVEQPRLPASWAEQDGRLYCLSCRREMAGEEGLAAAPEGTTDAERSKIRNRARLEFEIMRDPSRPDNEIAKACHTSAFAVRKVRAGLGNKA